MEAIIDMAESGHLVIGTLYTKSCAETIDRIINFYDMKEQSKIKNLLSTRLKAVISQRLLKSIDGDELLLVPEVMIVDNTVSACIRKEQFSVSEIEDAIQDSYDKGSISLIDSLASLYVEGKLNLEQVKSQIEEKKYEILNKTIMQLNLKKNLKINRKII